MAFHVFVQAFIALGLIATASATTAPESYIIKWSQDGKDVVVKGNFHQFDYVISAKEQLQAKNEDWCPMAYEILLNMDHSWHASWHQMDQDTFDYWVRKDECVAREKRYVYRNIVESMPDPTSKMPVEDPVDDYVLLSDDDSAVKDDEDKERAGRLLFWTIFAACFLGLLAVAVLIGIFVVFTIPVQNDEDENDKEVEEEDEEPKKEEP
ncbi:hypothetical protein L596_013237 [Steinernema carpocapsae]|uniref:Uncharacterized protein n=1 Tax=Steinernema carpocapsae TaxID=34508 RepID=A0A4U5P070_STECR|nr:hypothetical protein L596_013237 [Steinernema carpocapsae]